MSSGVQARVQVHRPDFSLDVALDVAPGEVVAVLGPNGAGKSTLLGVLAGLLQPDGGEVRIGDRVVTGPGVHVPPHRRGVGLLAQQALLFPHLSALRNVAFGPRALGVPRRAAEQRARELLAAVDAAELADRRPAQLSGGQQQRVALARALAPQPGLLLLDEPLAALDIDATPAMRSLLRRVIRAAGQTAVLVTHSVLDVLMLADRVLVLTDGKVVEQGPVREVLVRPRSPFTARIAGLNLITGRCCADGLRTRDGELISGRVEGVTVGEPAAAVFPPSAVGVFVEKPHGSPRNLFAVRLAPVEPRGDVIRLRSAAGPEGPDWLDGLAADVTPAAVAELGLEQGAEVWFAVKATEVGVHATGAAPTEPEYGPHHIQLPMN